MKTKKCKTSSIKIVLLLLILLNTHSSLFSQSCYHPFVDSIVSKVSLQSISKFNRELSGDTSTIIGGQPYTIISRYWEHPGNQKAAQYIYERFLSYGLETRYDTFSTTGINVIAKKTGTKYPNQYFILCAHYDSYAYGVPVLDTVPGADDDASGVCAVLEAARIFSNYNFDYTIIFAAWDEEERYLYGSKAYADTAFAHGDSIIAVINLDMIAWDGNNDNVLRVGTDTNSMFFADIMISAMASYSPLLLPWKYGGGSDEISFWNRGYKAILVIEDRYPDFNPNYHTIHDTYSNLNRPYFLRLTKSAIAALIVLQRDYIINFNHNPLQSNSDTLDRIATVVITSNHRLANNGFTKNPYSPRLYYKVGNGLFNFINAFYNHLDTFKFLIPGQSLGETVSYYFAAQDSLGTMVGSLPAGARGINPPGTIPPTNLFTYRILKQFNPCSNTVPKNLPPGQMSYDSINIIQSGSIFDFDLNLTIHHTNDEDLYIFLTRPGSQIQLSTNNGGTGDNYINTTFDDEASIPITQGTPPFTGSFRPQQPLSTYDTMSMQGTWTLKIFNASSTVTGQLVNWCLNFEYYDPVSVVNNQIPVRSSLHQNFPNPFNPTTSIRFDLPKSLYVKLNVYDILGREVAVLVNKKLSAGSYEVEWPAPSGNGSGYPSGVYFYRLTAGDFTDVRKMILIK